jgi:hypothetical protein
MTVPTGPQLHLAIQLPPFKVVTTIHYSQRDLIRDLLALHELPTPDADVTFGRGALYPAGILPRIRLDLFSPPPGGAVADCRALPLPTGSLTCILLDPPWLAGGGAHGIMATRYGHIHSTRASWALYRNAIHEAARVLKRGGCLIVKCQDNATRDANRFTHVKVYQYAQLAGLRALDLFIHVNHSPLASNIRHQRYARKNHSYFWVFRKPKARGPLPAGGFLR